MSRSPSPSTVTTTARRPERCGAFSATASDRRTSARTLLASRAKRDRVRQPSSRRSTPGCRRPARAKQALQALEGVAVAGGPEMRRRVDAVRRELESGRAFEFSDCAIGNLVFAGCYLLRGRRFNDAVDDYCALLGVAAGLIENVTDGTNAFLVALEQDRGVLVSEAEIVDAKQQNRISDVFLIDRPLSEDDRAALERLSKEQCAAWLEARSRTMPLNPRLRARIAAADLIIYAPGTQHSSLFPSYLTKDLSRAIASNLKAIKLLVTNIQADAEISGSTAVDIVERAVYYLKEKGRLPLPVPTLITHYIINDPKILESDADAGYVPLGHLETLEDPRLVRIGHYEDGVSGTARCVESADAVPSIVSLAAPPPAHRRVVVRRRIAEQTEPVRARDASRRHPGSRGRRHRLLHRRRRPRRCVHAAAAGRAAESSKRIAAGRQGVRAGARRAGVRLCRAFRVLRHVSRRRSRQRNPAADERQARRRVGEPPAVVEGHRGVLPASV